MGTAPNIRRNSYIGREFIFQGLVPWSLVHEFNEGGAGYVFGADHAYILSRAEDVPHHEPAVIIQLAADISVSSMQMFKEPTPAENLGKEYPEDLKIVELEIALRSSQESRLNVFLP